MITAVDTSVILDILTDDPSWAEASQQALTQAAREGSLILCETVLAEIIPCLQGDEINELLDNWGLCFMPSSKAAAEDAGRMYARYLQRKGPAKRVIADFLVGAHALHHADRLLARDRGYFRDYFKQLTLIEPVFIPRK